MNRYDDSFNIAIGVKNFDFDMWTMEMTSKDQVFKFFKFCFTALNRKTGSKNIKKVSEKDHIYTY